MPKAKKRPSKKAKAAIKILSGSKLIATARTLNEGKKVLDPKLENQMGRTAAANKPRPEKKRG